MVLKGGIKMNIFAEKEKNLLKIRKFVFLDKKTAKYIKIICLFRIAFLEKHEEDTLFYQKKVYNTEDNLQHANVSKNFTEIKKILMKMDKKELKRVLDLFEEK